MATLGMRHAVLWVTDPSASATFYQQALGLQVKTSSDQAVFMSSPDSATDHDLGLFRADGAAAEALDADIARWGADRPGRGAS